MIISTDYKFIFVHIPKTAGMSVTDAFGKYGREKKRTLWRSFTRRLPIVESPYKAHFKYHEAAKKIEKKLSKQVFDTFLSFSVVRNPFDHAVSHYEYMKQFRIKRIASKVGELSFRDYLEYRMLPPSGDDTVFARLPDQCYFLTGDTGDLLVKRLIRFENLDVELNALATELGLENFLIRHVNKTKSRSDRKRYQDYYDAETEALVRKIYHRDFDLLDYPKTMK